LSDVRERLSVCRVLLWSAFAAAWNPWSVAWFLSPDGYITDSAKRGVIFAAELLIISAVLILMRRSKLPRGHLLSAFLWCGVTLGSFGTARSFAWIETEQERVDKLDIKRVAMNEQLHLSLVPRFKALARSLEDLEVPGLAAEQLFGQQVRVTDVVSERPSVKIEHVMQIEESEWTISAAKTVERPELSLFEPLLDSVAWVEHAKAYLVKTARSLEEPEKIAESEGGFSLLVRNKDGRVQQISSHAHIVWRNDPMVVAEEEGGWRIAELTLTDAKVISARGIAFEEVLDKAVADKELLVELRENGSINEVIKQLSEDDWSAPYEYFQARSSDANEAVSVVDYDGDGADDLYFCADVGRNVLLRNQGDGTFVDVTDESGLACPGLSNVALFFDYDNDGDPDCFLGRSHATSRFLRNDGGRFRDVTGAVFGGDGPMLVESASAADLDGDGLLDLYVSTYVGTLLSLEMQREGRPEGMLFDRQLAPEEARRYWALNKKAENRVRDRFGPPNRLYQNNGESFSERHSSELALYRNTYQAVFSDYDSDGDQDIYVANDFAPNYFFRNDGGWKFVDVTEETNSADIGFGMGASFGDYDHDGDFDLYVSNMFSKAGRRITASISSLDERFGLMARGNSLLEFQDGRFERVSSLDSSGMQVEKSGWAWGAMFVDADLDTWPDLYSLNGMYTAPAPFESDVDL
jgi:hypothetical protein